MKENNERIETNKTKIIESPVHRTLEERVEESGLPLEFSSELDWGEPEGSEVY